MSLADHIFIDMCNDILTNGTLSLIHISEPTRP